MEISTHFLYPAAIFASKKPHLVTTILGSCVAVCLFDSVSKMGGINHFMLPLWNGQGLASPKYGNIAIDKLLEKLISMGALQRNIKAKVFGGAEVIDTKISQFHIGERNIIIAKEILAEKKINIVSSSVGGKLGRKIRMNTGTGEILHKFIQRKQVEDFEIHKIKHAL